MRGEVMALQRCPKGHQICYFWQISSKGWPYIASNSSLVSTFGKMYNLLAITILGSVEKFLQEQPQLVLQRWYIQGGSTLSKVVPSRTLIPAGYIAVKHGEPKFCNDQYWP